MIYFVRHGQTDWNIARKIQGQQNIPLNGTGRQQALSLAPDIKALSLSRIISSDLKRAEETAGLLNTVAGVPVCYDAHIREMALGDLEGRSVSCLTEEIWHTLFERADSLHAEPLVNVYGRVNTFLSDLDDEDHPLVVTHAGILKMIAYCRDYPNGFDYDVFAGNYLNLWLKNATIYRWDEVWS